MSQDSFWLRESLGSPIASRIGSDIDAAYRLADSIKLYVGLGQMVEVCQDRVCFR